MNVQDLFDADTDDLSSRLMAFGGFKAGCAFKVWKQHLHSNRTTVDAFSDIYQIKTAKTNVNRWKNVASRWDDKFRSNEATVVEGRGDPIEEVESPVSLKDILSSREAHMLKSKCDIGTAQELFSAKKDCIVRRLAGHIGASFPQRDEKEVGCIIEGMLYSWTLRAQEALQVDEAESNSETLSESSIEIAPATTSRAPFKTQLSHFDLRFIVSQNITSDEQLAKVDLPSLAQKYAKKLGGRNALARAAEAANIWQRSARSVLGLTPRDGEIPDRPPPCPRLGKGVGTKELMYHVQNLCQTVSDANNNGLPKRSIFTYDYSYGGKLQ